MNNIERRDAGMVYISDRRCLRSKRSAVAASRN